MQPQMYHNANCSHEQHCSKDMMVNALLCLQNIRIGECFTEIPKVRMHHTPPNHFFFNFVYICLLLLGILMYNMGTGNIGRSVPT